jgi:uncharacterized protein (DUF4415 family)
VKTLESFVAMTMMRSKPKAKRPTRGRPPSGKIIVTMRLDPEIIAAFKATGPGWQARINDLLRKAVEAIRV